MLGQLATKAKMPCWLPCDQFPDAGHAGRGGKRPSCTARSISASSSTRNRLSSVATWSRTSHSKSSSSRDDIERWDSLRAFESKRDFSVGWPTGKRQADALHADHIDLVAGVPQLADDCRDAHVGSLGPISDSCTAANRRGTDPGYCLWAAEKAHVRFARDQPRSA